MPHIQLAFLLLCTVLSTICAQSTAPPGGGNPAETLPALVRKYCVECHAADEPEAGLNLQAALIDSAAASRVEAAQLHGRVLRAVSEARMPPRSGALPQQDAHALLTELRNRMRGVELEIPVPRRRLAREEVQRTVRAQFGIDVPPEVLPEDELTSGFDNVGNARVLSATMSAQLVAAAEQMAALIIPDCPDAAVPEQRVEADEFRCNRDSGVQGDFVVLYMNSTLTRQHTLMHAGTYELAVRAAEHHGGSEAASMEVRVNGERVATHAVACGAGAAEWFTCRLVLAAGAHEISVSFVNDYYEEPRGKQRAVDRNLLVDAVAVRGRLITDWPPQVAAMLSHDPGASVPAQKRLSIILSPLVHLLWRAPVDSTALQGLVAIGADRMQQGDCLSAAMRTCLAAALAAPRFWMREGVLRESGRQSGIALASRISYFLWSSAPDAQLLEAAERGALNTPEQIRQTTRTMLDDPRARALSERFAPQWLELRNLAASAPDPARFPEFTVALRQSMSSELPHFFEVLRKNRLPIQELLTADWSCIDATLAAHYGVAAPAEPFARTALPQRGGVLGMAALLTVTSNPGRTSPVKRGRWILEHLLDAPPPPPPPNAGNLDERPEIADSLPLKERLELHRRDPSCASCHRRMDALGFALERFDGVGAWRTRDGRHAVDDAGVLPDGRAVQGLASLKDVLRGDRGLARSLLRALFTTAIGRPFDAADEAFLEDTLNSLPAEPTLDDCILAVTGSELFRRVAQGSTR